MLLEQGCKRRANCEPRCIPVLKRIQNILQAVQIAVLVSTIVILKEFLFLHHFIASWPFINDKFWQKKNCLFGDKTVYFCAANTLPLYVTQSLVWQPLCGLWDTVRLLYHMKTSVESVLYNSPSQRCILFSYANQSWLEKVLTDDIQWKSGQFITSAVWLGMKRHRRNESDPWKWYYDTKKTHLSTNKMPNGK